jgi:hypothetical protein
MLCWLKLLIYASSLCKTLAGTQKPPARRTLQLWLLWVSGSLLSFFYRWLALKLGKLRPISNTAATIAVGTFDHKLSSKLVGFRMLHRSEMRDSRLADHIKSPN